MNVEYYLLGDFNCDQISPISNNDTRLLNNITEIYGLTQPIQEATRITENTSTLLDVIYTNFPNKIVCSGVSHIGISDHSLVFAYRKVSADPPKRGHSTISYIELGKFNSADFRSDIAQHDWGSIDQLNNPNDMWAKWKEMFIECIDRHAPLKSKRVRLSKSPWINSSLKKLMHKRDILKLKAIRSENPSDWREFRKHRNFVNSQVRITKQSYYNNAFQENKGKMRNSWRVINELTFRKVKNSSIKEIKLNDKSIHDSPELSETFNSHFATIGPKLANNISQNSDSSYLNYLWKKIILSSYVSLIILKFSKYCPNYAKLKPLVWTKFLQDFLKECLDLITASLCSIFNRSITSGIFPEEWKCAKVTPLFKNGQRSDLNNYRPISVTPIVAKVFERIIYDQLYAYLTLEAFQKK